MVRNYFKIAFRNLAKNPFSSIVNVMGLATAIGCCMVTYAFLSVEFNMEKQHTKSSRTFMLKAMVDRDGNPEWYGVAPQAIGLRLREDFSQIRAVTRIEDRNVIVKRGENVFQEWTRMVDPSFLEIFDFDFIRGDASVLQDRGNVIINKKMAEKYFGDGDPIGQTINMRFAGNENIPLKVGAVVKFQPMSTSFEFDFLTQFDLLEVVDPEFRAADWSTNISATFILVDDPSVIPGIIGEMEEYIAANNTANIDWPITEFGFEKLATLYDSSNNIRWDISRQADVKGQWVLSIIALLMLTLACLNYLNIAISSSVKRLKEIGIRKVIGANRSRLILQFMSENLMLSFLALVMGTLLGTGFFLPSMNDVFGTEMGVDLLNMEFYIFLIGLLFLTAVASGAYPAMYISSFQIVSILKGKMTFGKRNLLSKIFLSFQFIIACIGVVSGVLFSLNNLYISERPWGYDHRQTLMVELEDPDDLQQFKTRMEQNPDILSTSLSAHHLGLRMASSVVSLPARKLEARRMDVEASYLETMGLEILSGKNFRSDQNLDQSTVLINETFAKNLEWEDPIDQTFRFDSVQYRVIGMVRDFHYYNFWTEIEPVFIRIGEEGKFRFLGIRTDPENTTAVYQELENTWAEMFPNLPFNGNYQSQLFWEYFRNTNGHKVIMIAVAIMAILMTCLGLYGLVALNISGRIREFSIRKVLGANYYALSRAVGSHFVGFMLLALLIGGPVSYWIVTSLFDMIYSYHMQITFIPIALSILLIVFIVLLTISTHLIRVARANPTDGLRVE